MKRFLTCFFVILLLCNGLIGCKKDSSDRIYADPIYIYNNLETFQTALQNAKHKQDKGEELTDEEKRLTKITEIVVPTPNLDTYHLHAIHLQHKLTYIFYSEEDNLSTPNEIMYCFSIPNYIYNEDAFLNHKAIILENGGIEYEKDGVIYDEKHATMYFVYHDTWAEVTVTSSMNTYDQLLALCQYEIVSVYDANTPVQTTGTQATSAKATATN